MRLAGIKFRHLECFLEIVRQKSLTRAADALFLAQPTVSKTLQELEEVLGARLLDRGRGGVSLTNSGEIFHRFADASVSALRAGVEQLHNISEHSPGLVRVGCPFNVATQLMPDAIAKFQGLYPTTRFHVQSASTEALVKQLRDGDVSMIVGRLPETSSIAGLRFEPLYHEQQVFVVRSRHPLINETGFATERLASFPFVMHNASTSVQQDVNRFLAGIGLRQIEPALVVNGPDLARRYLASSDAIWCVPQGLISKDVADGALAILPINTSFLRSLIGITTRPEFPLDERVNSFIETLRNVAISAETSSSMLYPH